MPLLLPVLPILLIACVMLYFIGVTIRKNSTDPDLAPSLWYHLHAHDEMSGE